MITLNLLPPSEKTALKTAEIKRWIAFYGTAVLGLLFIFVIFLMIIWFVILFRLRNLSTATETAYATLKTRNLITEESKIKNLNERLRLIDERQTGQYRYWKILARLAELVPNGIRLNELNVQKKGDASLGGWASQREQILLFKSQLEESKYFKNIESPLANLIKQTDIDFNFNFKVNFEAFANDEP